MTWQRARIGDLANRVTKGTTPTTLGYKFAENGIPFIRVQNLLNGKVDISREPLFIDNATHETLERSQIQKGDLLISIAGTIGRTAVVDLDTPLNCNQAVAIVRLNGSVARKYVLHWLASADALSQMTAKGVTGTITNLSLTQIKSLKIPLPPLPEQKRIAAILDAADVLRTKRRESLAQLDTLLQSTFLDMFGDPVTNPMGWKLVAFHDCIADRTSSAKKILKSEYSDKGEWQIIDQSQSEVAGYADVETPFTAPLPVVVFGDHTRCVKLVRTPFLLGADGAKIFVPKQGMNAVFLRWLLPLLRIPDLGYSRHMKEVKRLNYPLPPIDLQRQFAIIVESVERQKARLRAHLAELDTLFASLQSRAFNGQL
jgi:type I restriction enzyme S subunit